jgi:hypothetical protein
MGLYPALFDEVLIQRVLVQFQLAFPELALEFYFILLSSNYYKYFIHH